MEEGERQVIVVGDISLTSSGTVASTNVKLKLSAGVNIADRVCIPGGSTSPRRGEYAKVPGTDAVAFSCTRFRAVPWRMRSGSGHITVGVDLATDSTISLDVGRYLVVGSGV